MQRTIRRVDTPIPSPIHALRVAAYARVSSGKDAMLRSLSAQVSYYSNLIQQHKGWLYCGVYSDEALTGTKDSRDGFQALLDDCRAGKIDLVITKSISRFARNTVTLLETVRELKSLGVDVFFEEQNIHSISGDGELLLTILASYAQAESLSASENRKWQIRKAYERGEQVNLRFLFGYRIHKGQIEIDPITGPVVQEVFRRFIAGESYGAISRDLNARAIPRAFDGRWNHERIREIVSNEKYTGNALLQKVFINNHLEKKVVKNTGQLPMYYAQETHPALVDMDTFEMAKERLNLLTQTTQRWEKPKRSVLSGRIICGKCGNPYKRVMARGVPGWNCSTYQSQGRRACPAKKIPESTLLAELTDALETDDFDPGAFNEKIAQIHIPEHNHLRIFYKDGSTEERVWVDRSRRESWTEEKREAARQYEYQRRNA